VDTLDNINMNIVTLILYKIFTLYKIYNVQIIDFSSAIFSLH